MYGFVSFYFCFFIFYIVYAVLLNYIFSKNSTANVRFDVLVGMFLPLLMLGGLRGDTVGGDLEYYIPYFDEACKASNWKELMDVSGHEPGYIILTKIIGFFSSNHHFFLFFTILISLIGPFFFIYKFSINPTWSVLLYYLMGFYTNTFNNVRQSIAMSIVFCSYYFLFNKRYKIFIFLVLLATSFHYSAAVMLLALLVVRMGFSLKKVVLTFSSGTLAYVVLGSSILMTIVQLVYLNYDSEAFLDDAGGGWSMFLLYLVLFLVFLYIYYENRFSFDSFSELLFPMILSLMSLMIIIQMFASLFPSVTRMTHYFLIPSVFLIPNVAELIFDKKKWCGFVVFIGLVSVLFFYMAYSFLPFTNSNTQGVIPYVFLDTEIF